MATENNPFQLRCTLIGHSKDVRAVTTTANGEIITASRDKTAILWTEDPDHKRNYIQKIVYSGHESFVTSLCSIEGTENCPDGLVATGSQNASILIFHKFSSEPLHKLSGHKESVSCLSWNNGYLVSGSWDHTIKVWKNWKCISTLEGGHSGPIWSIAIINSDLSGPHIISASADKTIKLWKNGSVAVTYNGHTDCVRGIALLDSDRFLSCSNDSSIRLWNISGQCLNTYYGHTNYIYSIYCAPDCQSFISGGEDRSLRTWDITGNNTQTIYLPAQSVWSVAVLPNSDLVTGSSDSQCRIFTNNSERHAEKDEIKSYEETLSKFKMSINGVGGINKSELPDKMVLNSPGKRDGQTIMVRDGDKIFCYNWSQAKEQWESVGEVVGSCGSTKVKFQGREYDFVFDVDLDTGSPIKLPYNKGDDPWTVAQAFIYLHELPQDYLDTIGNFIVTNAGVSSTGSTPSSSSSALFDPLTGGSRYVPNGVSSSNISSQYFPQVRPVPFESANKQGILTKLKECSSTVADPLTDPQMEAMVNSATSTNDTADLAAIEPLQNALQWHPKNVWPVLDVLRLALRFENVHIDWMQTNKKGDILVGLLLNLLDPQTSPTNAQLLSLRCLSNMARHSPGRAVLASTRDAVMTAALKLSPYPNKNMEIAASTLMLNYSYIYYSIKNVEDQCQILSGAATIALIASDPEAVYRSLVALGTLLSLGGDLISLAGSLDLKPVVENILSVDHPHKVHDCARDVIKLL